MSSLVASSERPQSSLSGIASVAIQGPEGGYHGEAALSLVPTAELIARSTFEEVVTIVRHRPDVHAGILATGSNHPHVNDELTSNLELAKSKGLEPLAKELIEVTFALYGLARALPGRITTVKSQSVARGQCEDWLSQKLPRAEHVDAADGLVATAELVGENNSTVATIARDVEDAHLPDGVVKLESQIGSGITTFTLFGKPVRL